MRRYPLAEKFKAPQGEGLFTGTPFAFMRMVGCSVGQKVCTSCDTDFTGCHDHLGGGLFTAGDLWEWAQPYTYACITGGEPLDRDLYELVTTLIRNRMKVNVETSGTKHPGWLDKLLEERSRGDLYVCVSPKPGYLESMIAFASEIKVILGGLGDGPGWPTLEDALRWSDRGKLVYIQPRNGIIHIDRVAIDEVIKTVDKYPQLRLSAQMHKFLRTR